MNILFTGTGRRVELMQAFREAALRLGVSLRLYGADMADTAPALRYCDEVCFVPAMRDPGYIDRLLEICATDRIDLVIPTIDTDLMVLAENRDRFTEAGSLVMVSAPEMIAYCRDKNRTGELFSRCGLASPAPVNDWRRYKGGFPAFIKPKDGSSSIQAFRADTEQELAAFAEQIDEYVVQPFIRGREYTIDVFCDWEGVPLSVTPRERLQVRAGEVLKTRICLDETMIAEMHALCAVFKPRGPLTVQLIRDDAGKDWFIEINPRFGGGVPLSMKAGARTAEDILILLDGRRSAPHTDVADGAVYSRFDQSVCIRMGKGRICGVILDLDDTLYPERDYVRSGFRAVAAELGDPAIAEQLWAAFERGEPAVDAVLGKLGRTGEKACALAAYRSHQPEISLFPEAREMLRRLRESGCRLGIITDGRPEGQRRKIEALGLADLVDDILITDELGGAQFRKPCDIAFRILQTRWKLPANEILYAGDNRRKDFQGPAQLGMRTAWIRRKDAIHGEDGTYPVDAEFADLSSLTEYVMTSGV